MGLGHLSLELLPHFLVGDQDVGALDAGQVEGLAGGGADDAVHLGVLGHIAVDDVLAGEDQIVVDFVGDDEDVVLLAESIQLLQFLSCPHTAAGVVGGAQQHSPGLGGDCFFHGIPVHGVIAVLVMEGHIQQHTAFIGGGAKEGAVHRRAHQHFVAGLGDGVDCHMQSGDDAGSEGNPLFLDLIVVAALHPAHNSFIIFIG